MKQFVARHASKITGVLHGFDRMLFRGHLLRLCYSDGVAAFLHRQGVLLKNFGGFVQHMTDMLRDAAVSLAETLGRPVQYLESSRASKEEVALAHLRRHPIKEGLVCLLTCVEPCWFWQVFRSRKDQTQELRRRTGKCLHHYFYLLDPEFGWMHVRVQTWMPYTVQVYVNGREWLAQRLDRAGLGYRRADNCFLALDDVDRAQRIMDRMLALRWPRLLDRAARTVNPVLDLIAQHAKGSYHWCLHQCELATDIMFRRPEDLASLYPGLVRHAISQFGSGDVMRFLGKPLVASYRGEVVTNYKQRPEGIAVRHRAGRNSIKMYDKAGSVLRVETTTNDPSQWKRRRRAQGHPDSELKPRPLRKGTADMQLRAEVSTQANSRYLQALAAADHDCKLQDLLAGVLVRAEIGGRKVRALAPWSHPDIDLLRAIGRGEFVTNGFRNRDLLPLLCPDAANDPGTRRKASACITRMLRLLRAHRLIRRIEHTHRYQLTQKGRLLVAAVLTASDASITKLKQCA